MNIKCILLILIALSALSAIQDIHGMEKQKFSVAWQNVSEFISQHKKLCFVSAAAITCTIIGIIYFKYQQREEIIRSREELQRKQRTENYFRFLAKERRWLLDQGKKLGLLEEGSEEDPKE